MGNVKRILPDIEQGGGAAAGRRLSLVCGTLQKLHSPIANCWRTRIQRPSGPFGKTAFWSASWERGRLAAESLARLVSEFRYPPQLVSICRTVPSLPSAPMRTAFQREVSIGSLTQLDVPRSWQPRGKLVRVSESMLFSQGRKPPDEGLHKQSSKIEIDTSRLSDSGIMALPIPSAQVQQIVMSFAVVVQAVGNTRCIQDERIKRELTDISSKVDLARTQFRNGDVDGAIERIKKCTEALDRRAQQWKVSARQEKATRKNLSADKSGRMQAGHGAATSRFAQAQSQMSRLCGVLEQFRQNYQDPLKELEQLRQAHASHAVESLAATEATPATAPPTSAPDAESARAEPGVSVTRSAITLPDGFLDTFQRAPALRRQTVVQQFFDVQAEVKVDLRKTPDGRYTPIFQPSPIHTNRFYFFRGTGDIMLLRGGEFLRQGEGGAVLHVHYPETDTDETMRLVDFVRHVQKGVWLLAERAQQ